MADPRLGQLHDFLRRRAKQAKWLPSAALIAEMLALPDGAVVTDLLWQGEQAGLWQVLRDSGFRITGVVAGDGSWRVVRDRPQPRPQRRCLGCGNPFTPAHRYNFLCCEEKEAA